MWHLPDPSRKPLENSHISLPCPKTDGMLCVREEPLAVPRTPPATNAMTTKTGQPRQTATDAYAAARNDMVRLATCCARRGFRMSSLQIHTPDGKTWAIDPARTGGFRLFEVDPDGRNGPEEHDAVDGDTWDMGDLLDYLEAIGGPKTTPHRSESPGAASQPDPTT